MPQPAPGQPSAHDVDAAGRARPDFTRLNLCELRAVSHRDDLGPGEWTALLLEWQQRELRARGPILMLLEKWLRHSNDQRFDRFVAMHRLFQPWAGSDDEARACWEWWTAGSTRDKAKDGASRPRAGDGAWRPDARPAPGRRDARTLRDESAMHRCGYVVGVAGGLTVCERRAILDRFFTTPLPPALRVEFGGEYGDPWSEKRLRRMVTMMEWNIDRFRRMDPARFGDAVEAWAADLEYLRARWHDGWFPFPWPRVMVTELGVVMA